MTKPRLDADIAVGGPAFLADNLVRITAPNPSAMTGPGTNTYVLGSAGEYAVIDPGPLIDSHVQAILDFVGEGLKWIIVTHTHSDHSPAAAALHEATGAARLGLASVGELELQFQDETFQADRVLEHGQLLSVAGSPLRVIYTPGHVSNHLCFLLEEQGILFSGDHIMQGSTVAIVPPQGDMYDYLRSLELLSDYSISAIAPAHGLVIEEPQAEIDKLIEHRLWRESKVLEQLGSEPRTTTNLLTDVYDDVPVQMHWAAKFSLYAHLQKLCRENRASASHEVVLDSHEAIAGLDDIEWQLL